MIPEVAYVKLGWLLGNYKKDEAETLLSQNIAGEISIAVSSASLLRLPGGSSSRSTRQVDSLYT